MLILAAILAILMGVTLGFLGGGGSILTVPILHYVLDVPAKETIASSLIIVGTTASMGLVSHARHGNVVWRTGLIFAGFAMLGAFGGGQLAQFLAGPVLLLLFGLLMLVTGVAMLRKQRGGGRASHGAPSAPQLAGHRRPWWVLGLIGLFVGLLTGTVGAGGGFLIVPALVLLGGLGVLEAIGTSLLVIAMNSLAGFAGHATHVELDWQLTLIFTAIAAVGTLIGTRIARRTSPDKLRAGFAYFVFVMAGFVIYKESVAQFGHFFTGG